MKIPFAYILRSLWTRKLTTVLTAAGLALVAFVFAAVLMPDAGLNKTMVGTGHARQRAVHPQGSGDRDPERHLARPGGAGGKPANNGDDRVLVLIQLNGGNDGLNMVIPLDQYTGLNQVRPNLVLPESKVLKLRDKTGLHPSMTGLHTLYQEEKMAVVQSVGYPNQNRSDFRSSDIWISASEADEFLTTGWVGRYLDQKYPGFPEAYPNADCPDPFAITIGGVVSETCQGLVSNFSFTLTSKTSARLVEETVAAQPDGSCYLPLRRSFRLIPELENTQAAPGRSGKLSLAVGLGAGQVPGQCRVGAGEGREGARRYSACATANRV